MESTTLAVQSIPINKIKTNANDPRHVKTPKMIDAMAASLKAVGLKNPIKVQKISSQVAVGGSQVKNENQQPAIATPQNTPIGLGARNDEHEFEYVVISGHIRLAGAKKLGWETIPVLVLELTPDQALLEAILDNRGQKMTWLDEYRSIEALKALRPGISQRELGDQLGMSQASVNRGLKLLGYLNDSARSLIDQTLIDQADEWDLTENPVFRLTDLADPQKPTEEIKEMVGKALKVVIERRMTEPEVRKLVAWIKAGNELDIFGQQPGISTAQNTPKTNPQPEVATSQNEPIGSAPRNDSHLNVKDDPNAELWDGVPRELKIRKTAKGYRLVWMLSESEGPLAVYGAMSALNNATDSPNPKWAETLPQLTELAKAQNQFAADSSQLAAKAKEEKEKAKAEAKAQKAQAREETAKAKAEAKAQKAQAREVAKAERQLAVRSRQSAAKAETQTNLENHRTLIKQKVETLFGPGPLTDGLVQKCHEGNKAEALKTTKFYLAQSGKSPEEQAASYQEFQGDMNEHVRLMKKARIQVTVHSRQSTAKNKKPSESAQGRPEMTTSPTEPIGSAPRDDNSEKKGILDQVKQAVKDNIHLGAGDVSEDLIKDAKQAINYQIRRGMRKILKDMF